MHKIATSEAMFQFPSLPSVVLMGNFYLQHYSKESEFYSGFEYDTLFQTQPHRALLCFVVVLYLRGSSCGDGDGSPTYWLWLDRDHLHSAIPMFSTMLGFSNQINITAFQPALKDAFRLRWEKGIRAGIVTNPQLGQSVPMGWNLKSGFVSDEKVGRSRHYTLV